MTTLTAKQQFWSEQLEKAQRSGQPLCEYARAHNIPAQKLYQWRNALKKFTTTHTTHEEVQFAEVIAPDFRAPALRANVQGTVLDFYTLPDPQWLQALINNGFSK